MMGTLMESKTGLFSDSTSHFCELITSYFSLLICFGLESCKNSLFLLSVPFRTYFFMNFIFDWMQGMIEHWLIFFLLKLNLSSLGSKSLALL